MIEEVTVDAERSGALVAVGDIADLDPVRHERNAVGRALAEEQDVDDDVGAGFFLHRLGG